MDLQEILAGDDEEHAIMLHNYILHLIMAKEGITGANRRPPGRTGLRTEVKSTTCTSYEKNVMCIGRGVRRIRNIFRIETCLYALHSYSPTKKISTF